MTLMEKLKKRREEKRACAAEQAESCRVVPDELKRNDKGLIERKGFHMGQTVNYGEEFEEETMDKVFKPAIILLIVIFILFIAMGVLLFFFIGSDQFEPFFFKALFD